MSLANLNRVVHLDLPTMTLDWQVGVDTGWELVDAQGASLPDDDWFYFQHAPELKNDRLLVYDNGVGRASGHSTRITEYALDFDARVATLLWTWTQEGWADQTMGDADRLADGRVLVTSDDNRAGESEPHGGRLFELDPETGDVHWSLAFDEPGNGAYRAQRVADGCTIFANMEACPSLEYP